MNFVDGWYVGVAILIIFFIIPLVFIITIGWFFDRQARKELKKEQDKKDYSKVSFPLLLITFFFLWKTPVFAVDYISVQSSSACVQGIISSIGDEQVSLKVFIDGELTSNSQQSYDCFWTGGTLYLGHNTGSWHDSVSDSFSVGDVLKCEWSNGTLSAYRNGNLLTSGADSTYSSGTYIGIYNPAVSFSSFGECSTPEPTPTIPEPTPTPIPPTPTPIPPTPTGVQPTPTPTPNPLGIYVHEFCVLPTTSWFWSFPSGCGNPPSSKNQDTTMISVSGFSILNFNDISTGFEIFSGDFDISGLDLEDLQTKTFTGQRLYFDGSFNWSDGIENYDNIKLLLQHDLVSQTSLFSSQEVSGSYNCNGKIGQTYFTKNYDDLFDENGLLIDDSFYTSVVLDDNNSNCSTEWNVNHIGTCFQYTDNINENTITTGNTCEGGVTPILSGYCSRPLDFSITNPNLGAWIGYYWCQFKSLINDLIDGFIGWFTPDAEVIGGVVSELFLNFEDSIDSNIVGIISAPLTVIGDLVTATCVPLDIPIPFTGQDLQLPCYRPYLQAKFVSFFVLFDVVTTGVIGYYAVLGIFKILQKAKDPLNDKIEVMDI